LDIAEAGNLAVPVLALAGGNVTRRILNIERQSDVNLRVQAGEGLTPVAVERTTSPPAASGNSKPLPAARIPIKPPEPPTDVAKPRSPARLVGTWSATESAKGVISWQANEPVVAATLVTTLRPKSEATWDIELDAGLTVNNGVLDALRFDFPAALAEPLSVTPHADYAWENLAAGGRRLIVRPDDPIAGDYRVKIRGQLALGADKQAPIVNVVGAASQRRWLVLPTQSKDQRIVWERRGLGETRMPPGFGIPSEADAKFAALEVLGTTSQAIWKSFTPAQSEPTVLLADVWVDRRTANSFVASAVFDVLPAGRSECVIDVPSEVEIVRAWLGEVPVRPTPVAAGKVAIQIGPTYAPQTISLLYTGGNERAATDARFVVPWIDDWLVERTLWTVHHSSHIGRLSAATGHCRPRDHRQARQEVLSRLVKVAQQQSPLEAPLWEQPWRRRLAPTDTNERRDDGPMAPGPVDVLVGAGLGGGDVSYGMADRGVPAIDLGSYAFAADEGRFGRVLAFLLFGLAMVVTVIARRRGIGLAGVPISPNVLLALAGVLWWLFLWPGWLGLVVLLAAAWSGARTAWSLWPKGRISVP
jgi:hypothetical protein